MAAAPPLDLLPRFLLPSSASLFPIPSAALFAFVLVHSSKVKNFSRLIRD